MLLAERIVLDLRFALRRMLLAERIVLDLDAQQRILPERIVLDP
jgi:hypothetical protein